MHIYRPPSEGLWKVIFSVCPHFGGGSQFLVSDPGGVLVSDFWGVPSLRFSGGPRSWSQIWGGPGLRFSGGVPGLRFFGGGGVPSLSKGENFLTPDLA